MESRLRVRENQILHCGELTSSNRARFSFGDDTAEKNDHPLHGMPSSYVSEYIAREGNLRFHNFWRPEPSRSNHTDLKPATEFQVESKPWWSPLGGFMLPSSLTPARKSAQITSK
jgi:hypothetical protein